MVHESESAETMNQAPRFDAEYDTRRNVEEFETYSTVFLERVAPAFDNLREESERLQLAEYDRLLGTLREHATRACCTSPY